MAKKNRYRRYRGYGDETSAFTVFLIHGRDEYLVRKLVPFIQKKLHFKTIILKDERNGKTIIEKLQDKIWEDTDCALAVMSAEDETKKSGINARPNVLFEIGYCLGYFDQLYVNDFDNEIRPVVLVREDKTNIPSDLGGMETIEYAKKDLTNRRSMKLLTAAVGDRLNLLFVQIKEYYKEENK